MAKSKVDLLWKFQTSLDERGLHLKMKEKRLYDHESERSRGEKHQQKEQGLEEAHSSREGEGEMTSQNVMTQGRQKGVKIQLRIQSER